MQNKKRLMTVCAVALGIVALTGLGLKAWAEQEDDDVKIALPAAQVIASIQTAVAAKAGSVLEIEAEKENGKSLCEVTILANDGKAYEVEVDVAANKVLEIEAEDNEKDDD